jgi:hypothetical protein
MRLLELLDTLSLLAHVKVLRKAPGVRLFLPSRAREGYSKSLPGNLSTRRQRIRVSCNGNTEKTVRGAKGLLRPDPQSQKQHGGCRHIEVCTTKVQHRTQVCFENFAPQLPEY